MTETNQAPIAVDDVATTPVDADVIIDVLANDSDPDGDPIELYGVPSALHGWVEVNPDDTITYHPNPGYEGPDTITYLIRDVDGLVDQGEVAMTVGSDNADPVANDDTAEVDEDGAVDIDVLGNDTDPDGDPLTVSGTPTASHGTVTVNPDGTLHYEPDPDYYGEDTITYVVDDGNGGTDTGAVTVTVNPVNDDPVAVDDADTTPLDTPVVIDVLANDTDVDGDVLSVSGTPTSPDGTVTVNGDGTITFTPTPGFTGDATISYDITDGNGGTDTGEVVVTVTESDNADPVANDDTAEVDEDGAVDIDVLGNDTDPDGDPLTVSGTPTALHGTVTVNPDGTLHYEPDPDYYGEDTITYVVDDGNGGTDTGAVTVTVNPVNDDPIANDDAVTIPINTHININVMANDTDADGDTLSILSTIDSPDGTLHVNPNGAFNFVPNPGFVGDAVITYEISDGNGGTDTATLTVTVVDDGPVANDDVATTDEDEAVTIDVLANDTDPNDDPLVVAGTPTALHGTVTVNPDGTIEYTPDPDFTGEDTITYIVDDLFGNTDTGEVTVTVNPVNDDPVAVDDVDTTPLDTPVIIDVLANDTDVDNDPLAVLGTPTSPDGTVVVNGDGTITFTPDAGFTGDAVITYDITDGNGGTDTGEVTVTVTDESGLDGIVQGTDGDDVIDFHYTGDPHGDLVDHNDEILPGEGPNDDIIQAGAGDDYISAGAGNDDITGGDGSDIVHGGNGDDVIDTSGSAPASDYGWPGVTLPDDDPFDDRDTVYGGAGNDTISTGDDQDEIHGGNGDDTIDGGLDDDTIHGGTGDDVIIGGHGSDNITGGTGDDVIWGGMGAGTDPFNVPDEDIPGDLFPIADPVPDNGIDVIHGGAGNDTIYGQDDADDLYGDDGDDYIDGGIDNDTISGGTGNDTLLGGQGDDLIDGGAGDDDMDGGDDRDTFTNVNAGDDVDGGAGGDDFDVLDLTGSTSPGGSLNVTITGPDSNGNGVDGFVTYLDAGGNVTGTLNFQEIEEIIPCFTPGTMVATPKGERCVEELREGDKVITRDNGIQEIRWIGAKSMGWQDFAANEHLKPILVQAGSLGNGLPERDLLVSPNHRVLVANDRTALYFEEREVLVAAKHLVDNKGVSKVDTMGTSYIHFMFDHHEVVLSNGAWTESFQPGDMSLKGIGNAQRTEIFELFPELEKVEGLEEYAAARRTLKKHEAKILLK